MIFEVNSKFHRFSSVFGEREKYEVPENALDEKTGAVGDGTRSGLGIGGDKHAVMNRARYFNLLSGKIGKTGGPIGNRRGVADRR